MPGLRRGERALDVERGLTSLGFFLLGLRGFPRRYFAYLPEFQSLQILVGAARTPTLEQSLPHFRGHVGFLPSG